MVDEKNEIDGTSPSLSLTNEEETETVTEEERVDLWKIPEEKYHGHFDCFSGVMISVDNLLSAPYKYCASSNGIMTKFLLSSGFFPSSIPTNGY